MSTLKELLDHVEADTASSASSVAIVVEGETYELGEELGAAVLDLLRAAAMSGRVIDVAPLPVEITTGQAADLLGVSRPTVVHLIDSGQLPATRVGTRRRLRTIDVLTYRRRRTTSPDERDRLAAIVALSEELGLYGDAQPR